MIELALGRDGATTSPGTDARRALQLGLAAVWLLDGLLQYQSFMYTKAFGQMMGRTAALVVAAFIWVFGEAFGQILAGGATDPNSAPLLAFLALAYWPLATAGPRARRPQADGPPAMAVGRPEEKSA